MVTTGAGKPLRMKDVLIICVTKLELLSAARQPFTLSVDTWNVTLTPALASSARRVSPLMSETLAMVTALDATPAAAAMPEENAADASLLKLALV